MGFIADVFGMGAKPYQAQSGLQQGQLEQTYKQKQDALQQIMNFVAATQPGSAQALASQQALNQQLTAMGQGQGPSPATALLQQQAGDIAAQQASMMAGQRGASQNVGLVGRQAAQAGMQAQQRAGSQAAILRQQEQLSALDQLRQLSGQQVEQQRLGAGQAGQATLQDQQQALQAQAQQEQMRTEMSKQQQQQKGNLLGGLIGGVGSVLTGGLLPGIASAGLFPSIGKAVSSVPSMLFGPGSSQGPKGSNVSDYTSLSEGGQVEQPEEPHQMEQPDIVSLLLEGEKMSRGAMVPGKAKVDGDSYSNDTVPALLSPGEIVVPRSAAKDPEKAAAFAHSVAMRARKKKK
jgi:hypothetical protein